MAFDSQFIEANGEKLHVMTKGDSDAPLMLMLHGFPEYWAGWAQVAGALSDHPASSYRYALPDQRGYNLSSVPADRDAYDTKHLVADMKATRCHSTKAAKTTLSPA